MEFLTHNHRFALEIAENVPELGVLWEELRQVISSISDEDLIAHFELNYQGSSKSISRSINELLKQRLVAKGWDEESALFADPGYKGSGGRWRLDFSKATTIADNTQGNTGRRKAAGIAVEVAFNHGEAIAWNLLKPVIAGELNHVPQETRIGQGIGVVICATAGMKQAGGFDGAVGEYEKVLQYLDPMRNFLTTPLIIVGLQAPSSFEVDLKSEGSRKIGYIKRF
jgi:hypothetical protein